MLKYIISALCLICFVFNANTLCAQGDENTTIILKSGEKVTGKITEAIPERYVKIQQKDGTVRTINAGDIESMGAGQENQKSDKGISIIGGINCSYDASSQMGYLLIEPRIVIGGRVKIARLGLGIGFLYGKSLKTPDPFGGNFGFSDAYYTFNHNTYDLEPLFKKNLLMMNFGFNTHLDFGKKKVKPSLEFTLGYPVSLSTRRSLGVESFSSTGVEYFYVQRGLFHGQLIPGVSISAGKKLLFNLGLAYTALLFQDITYEQRTLYTTRYGKQNYNRQTRLLNAVGLSLNIIY